MLILLISIFLVFAYILKKFLKQGFLAEEEAYRHTESQYSNLLKDKKIISKKNDDLKITLEHTIALYDITKQICKSLEGDKVFNLFKEAVGKYVSIKDIKFLARDADLKSYPGYTIMPLQIDKTSFNYLAVNGINESEREKFNIIAQQFMLAIKRAFLYQRMQEMAVTDGLTGVLGRRFWLERFFQEIERSRKFNYNFSFLMIDIDHFKSFNDHYGHLVGDAILKEISKKIKENIRQIDILGRYAGDEFAIILIETDKNGARYAAERIRKAVEEKILRVYDENLKVTISIGISVFPQDATDAKTIIEKADQAMYQAKQEGKNRVCIYKKD